MTSWFSRKASLTGQYVPGDERFLSGMKEAELSETAPQARWIIYLMMLTIVVAVVWASVAKVDEIAKADGKVVPEGREQIIASLEGGILRAMLVREGTLVDKGQDLVQLDPTRVEAQQNEGAAKQLALKGTLARLVAESTGRPLMFPPEVLAVSPIVQGETEMFNVRRDVLEDAVSVNRQSLSLINRELSMAVRLSSKGLMSEVEVMRLRRQVNDLNLQIQERINRFRQDATTDMLRIRTELAQVEEQMVVKQDVLRRTILKSPVRGMVKNIRMNTIGGVVPGGATIMEIVPVGQRVLIEVKIKPVDIGFISKGMPATIKLSAYDYYTYGGLKGTIESISPDAFGDENNNADARYYRALIRSDESNLRSKGRPLSVLPGMSAVADIRTGERTVLSFILRPMMKSREAFQER